MNKFLASNSLIKQPSAWLPGAISLAALIFLLSYAAIFGVANQPGSDEGTPAHIFQLLMVLQLPIMAYFAIRWLPKQPKQSLLILAAQIILWFIPILTVLYLESL